MWNLLRRGWPKTTAWSKWTPIAGCEWEIRCLKHRPMPGVAKRLTGTEPSIGTTYLWFSNVQPAKFWFSVTYHKGSIQSIWKFSMKWIIYENSWNIVLQSVCFIVSERSLRMNWSPGTVLSFRKLFSMEILSMTGIFYNRVSEILVLKHQNYL